jgi:hypothetical protein
VSAGTDLARQRFLIIAGTSKAGTTSLFNYLAEHPRVSAATTKETRFFLDGDYPLQSELRFGKDDTNAYFGLFPEKKEDMRAWRLEATPDYLYSPGTARRIREALPNVRLIFLLREPVSRLISFYRFGQTMGEVPQRMSFDDFVQVQRDNDEGDVRLEWRHPAFHALRHGRYSGYLQPFLEVFGRSCIHVDFHENLRRAPLEAMRGICRFAGIDSTFYEDYSFGVANKGVTVRSPGLHNVYWRTKQKIRSRMQSAPRIRAVLRRIGARMDAIYDQANVTVASRISMSSSTADYLRSYYSQEAIRLHDLLGLEVPWSAELPPSIARKSRASQPEPARTNSNQ